MKDHPEARTAGADASKWNIADTREELDVLRKKVKASTEAYNILKASLEEA